MAGLQQENPVAVLGALRTAGAGLLLAAISHGLPMLANACDWRSLIRGANRPGIASMLHLVWVRESVNSMLPVARIGGEVVLSQDARALGRASVDGGGQHHRRHAADRHQPVAVHDDRHRLFFAHAQSNTLRLGGTIGVGRGGPDAAAWCCSHSYSTPIPSSASRVRSIA